MEHRRIRCQSNGENVNTVTAAITAARKSVIHKVEVSRERARLERDLSRLTSPSEVAELQAIIARHEPSETRELERAFARVQANQYVSAQSRLSPR